MKAEIIGILELDRSHNGNRYMRIKFKLEDGQFAVTDLCPSYRNWKNWRGLLEVGVKLGNLEMKPLENNELIHIDADSHPYKITPPLSPDEQAKQDFKTYIG